MASNREINTQAEFDSYIERFGPPDNLIENLDFSDCKFNFNLEVTTSLNTVSFYDCIFRETVHFSSNFKQKASFRGSVFEKGANFNKTEKKIQKNSEGMALL